MLVSFVFCCFFVFFVRCCFQLLAGLLAWHYIDFAFVSDSCLSFRFLHLVIELCAFFVVPCFFVCFLVFLFVRLFVSVCFRNLLCFVLWLFVFTV